MGLGEIIMWVNENRREKMCLEILDILIGRWGDI